MWPFGGLLISGVAAVAYVQNTLVDAVSLTPANAVAQFRLLNTGVAQGSNATPSNFTSLFTWLLSGAAGDYECRWVGTGDTGALIQGSLNTWLNLGTSRLWAIQDTSPIGSPLEISGPLEIGLAGENTALFTATLTLRAEESA